MTDHQSYEILGALAASGQLDECEQFDFDQHRTHCPICRDQLQDLISVGFQLQLHSILQEATPSMPAGSLERFRARTIREGIAPRTAPSRPSASYLLASAAALFVIVASLTFMPHAPKATDELASSQAPPIANRQSLSACLDQRPAARHRARVIHAHVVQHGLLRLTDIGANDTALTTQRFPQALTASYPYFGAQVATPASRTGYPALGRSQISHLDLFPALGDSTTRSAAGKIIPAPPVDIASTGKVFDFAPQIRQLLFRLPTAQ
jgi:hypothetical protein